MSHHNNQKGFTLVELIIGMVVIGVLSTAAFTFFTTSLSQYLGLQKDSLVFGDLAIQAHRITNVLRGATSVADAQNSEVTVYAYFAPNDTYVSLIRYYISPDNTKILADLTSMTANPPIGTLITSSKRTVTIMQGYKPISGVNLFTYLNSGGSVIDVPVVDLQIVKGIKVSLAVPSTNVVKNGTTQITSEVTLRNRKTNL